LKNSGLQQSKNKVFDKKKIKNLKKLLTAKRKSDIMSKLSHEIREKFEAMMIS